MSAVGGLTVLVCDGDHTASKAYASSRTARGRRPQITTRGSGSGRYRMNAATCMALAGLVEVIRERGNAIIVRGELDEAGRAALAR